MRMALAAATLGVALLTACGGPKPPLEIEDAWLRATPPGASVTAGYASLHNPGDTARTIRGARSPAAGMVMIHTVSDEDGMMRMRAAGDLTIAPGESRRLEPGSTHLMLMDLNQPLVAGETWEVTWILADGQQIESRMQVR